MRKRILKQLALTSIAAGLTMQAWAVAEGFYMGLMMGPATNGGGQQTIQVLPLPTQAAPQANVGVGNPQSQQFGSRLFFGYKFHPIASFEGGFTYFSGVNYILKNDLQTSAGGTTVRVRGIDVMGKLDYSFQNTIGVFGKLGVAAMYVTTPGGLNVTNWHQVITRNRSSGEIEQIQTINSGSNTYTNKFAPVFAIGASYDLTQNWVADLSWTRYMVGGVVSNMDLYAFGISYHFVDIYCGQFLC